jgi:hypothetical protein
VSNGDSGGPFIMDADGRVVSCVCCSTAAGVVSDVFGASVEQIRGGMVQVLNDEDWKPVPLPRPLP